MDPALNWLHRFQARGYVWVRDENDSQYFLHQETERFILGVPYEGGISLHLWDDFFNGFERPDFGTDEEYLDAVEQRFTTLWTQYDV